MINRFMKPDMINTIGKKNAADKVGTTDIWYTSYIGIHSKNLQKRIQTRVDVCL